MAVETPTKRQEKEGKIIEMCYECHKPIEIPKRVHDEIEAQNESVILRQYIGCKVFFLHCERFYYHDTTCYEG